MNDPREILMRIERRRRHLPGPGAPRTPAPAPVAPAPQAVPVPQNPTVPQNPANSQNPPAPQAAPAQPVPRPVGGHALYSELMRSHDRMGTRHLRK